MAVGRTREEKESSQVRVVIASRVECLESVAVGDGGESSLVAKERSHHDLLYSKSHRQLPNGST